MKLSQEALADRAGLDRSFIGQVERGETNISLLNLLRIAEGLNVGPERLVRGLRLPRALSDG
jgi:transcriptional regulator with XRE-family HTH domain